MDVYFWLARIPPQHGQQHWSCREKRKTRRRRTENNNKCRNLERLKWRLFFFIPHSFGVEEAAARELKPLLLSTWKITYPTQTEEKWGLEDSFLFSSLPSFLLWRNKRKLVYPILMFHYLPIYLARLHDFFITEGDNWRGSKTKVSSVAVLSEARCC